MTPGGRRRGAGQPIPASDGGGGTSAAKLPAIRTDARGRAVFAVRVVPRATRNAVAGERGDALLVRLAAPPVQGAANDALLDLLSDLFDCPRRRLTIAGGQTSRLKRIAIEMEPEETRRRLRSILDASR